MKITIRGQEHYVPACFEKNKGRHPDVCRRREGCETRTKGRGCMWDSAHDRGPMPNDAPIGVMEAGVPSRRS